MLPEARRIPDGHNNTTTSATTSATTSGDQIEASVNSKVYISLSLIPLK